MKLDIIGDIHGECLLAFGIQTRGAHVHAGLVLFDKALGGEELEGAASVRLVIAPECFASQSVFCRRSTCPPTRATMFQSGVL